MIKLIFIIIITIVLLSYFGVDLHSIVDKGAIMDRAQEIWSDYLRSPLLYVWDDIFFPLVWAPLLDSLHRIGNAR